MTMRTDYCGGLEAGDVDRRVSVCGWVASRREHSEHLAFVDLRDHTGVVQCVVDHAHDLRPEYVLRITGTVRRRPRKGSAVHEPAREGDDVQGQTPSTIRRVWLV